MKRNLLIAECLSQPWALMPERIAAMTAVIARWSMGAKPSEETMASIDADRSAREARRAESVVSGGAIAVLPLYGVITQRGNMMDAISGPGSTSTEMFSKSFREAMNDPSVSQILIDIDSPGGSVYGTAELGAEIFVARGQKPVVAIANSLAASAAYWIGTQASELYVTPGGEVGSIGVWQAHEDWSKYMAELGVNTTLISAGKFKVEGNPYQPLDAEALSFLQSRIDDYYGAFTKAVSKGRGVPIESVRGGMGQGRCMGADAALAEGMVDGIATFGDVVKKMQRSQKTVNRAALATRELSILG